MSIMSAEMPILEVLPRKHTTKGHVFVNLHFGQYVGLGLCFIVLFRPGFMGFYPLFQYSFAAVQIIFLFAMVVKFFYSRHKINSMLTLCFVYCFASFFQTLLFSSDGILNWGLTAVTLLSVALYLSLYFQSYRVVLIEIWQTMSFLYLLINLISLVFVNFSFDAVIFLGSRIGITSFALMLISLSFMLDALSMKRLSLRTLASVIIVVLNVYICNVSTAWVGISLLVTSYALFRFTPLFSRVKASSAFLAGTIVSALEVCLRFQEFFSGLIAGVLGKSLSLTGRTYIWDLALLEISESPVWGHGVAKLGAGGVFMDGAYWPMHNSLLQVIYEGGLLNLLVYLSLVVLSLRKCKRIMDSHISSIFAATMLAFSIAGITSSVAYSSCFFALITMGYIWGEYRVCCCKEENSG